MPVKTQIAILPDAPSVVSFEERQIFSELVETKRRLDELTTRFEAQKAIAKEIVEEKQAGGKMDKTFVLSGTEITRNTRSHYSFSRKVAEAEDAATEAQNTVKRLKASEIENGTAQLTGTTTFLSFKDGAALRFNREDNTWISTYQTKAKAA